MIVDGKDAVMGRLAARIAKLLLRNEEVHLVNAESIVMTGDWQNAVDRYQQKRRLQDKANPEDSPKWPKVPRMLVKRIIRGMLPWKAQRGRDAFKRLRVYHGIPKEFAGKEIVAFPELSGAEKTKFFTMQRLCKGLGYNKVN